ncbi:cytochrome P450 [Mycena rebaudengoi]|nr:cytochrome P450 [Mycena rebaudengoi]
MVGLNVAYCFGALGLLYFSYRVLFRRQVDSIPAIGSSGAISSFLGALRFFSQGRSMIQEGCNKCSDSIFRIPMLTHWEYIVSGRRRTLEVVAAPDDQLSFPESSDYILQTEYTMGPDISQHPEWHLNVIRSTLTRNLPRCFPEVRNEICSAFEDILSITAHTAIMDVVCRTSNRLFVGLPLCRNPEWLKLNIHFTIDVVMAAEMLRMLPPFLRPIFAPLITSRKRNLRKADKIARSLLEDRLNSKDDESRPNDFISWLLDAATEKERTIPSLLERILSVNFAAIHSTSATFTHALFDLAAHPEYITPLRLEVERIVSDEGWTKEALGNMHQIDSFLRESQRMNGIGLTSMARRVVNPKGFRFSDGQKLPYGAYMQIATLRTHYNTEIYHNPDEFDAFRFSCVRQENKEQGHIFHQHMVTTGVDYLPFGHGRHACPGRFFAATELKAMLAHVVMNYDVKLDESAAGVRPPSLIIGFAQMPNTTAKVYFRKRAE